ncbi:MAG: nickel pincer cofactor biosynthesis protein LarC [Clostridia bacterium]|nr:nickel pincer cofactor biosynthesis protein LarC [Clostridia bacterium]
MKTLYFECGMGAAGDMLTASLSELFDNKDEITSFLNSLGIEGVEFIAESAEKCGIRGTHISVLIHGEEENGHHHSHHHGHEHHHGNGMPEIKKIISGLNVSGKVKDDITAVYDIIAHAESEVHGAPVEHIHFHEVGALDAVADIAAVCALIEKLAPDRIVASPINTGSGTVKCAHGILPVPAPATAVILKGIPAYSSGINSELCTPTGAAILKHFADEFAPMPPLKIEKTGYGMGKKDFETANCVRAFLSDTDDSAETVYELSCNIDDMTGEEIAFAAERCFEAGALDVYTIPIGMKKGRPGIMLCALCKKENKDIILNTIFTHTSTLGIRENSFARYTLDRKTEEIPTQYGIIHKKVSHGYGVKKEKFEYDDLAKAAAENKKTINEIKKEISKK